MLQLYQLGLIVAACNDLWLRQHSTNNCQQVGPVYIRMLVPYAMLFVGSNYRDHLHRPKVISSCVIENSLTNAMRDNAVCLSVCTQDRRPRQMVFAKVVRNQMVPSRAE